jgi:Ca2+-binding RTX toxin-like protein
MAAKRTVFIDTALSNYASLAAQYDANLFNVVLLNRASPASEQIQNWLKSNNASPADINIVSPSDGLSGFFTPRIVYIDPGVANVETVISGVPVGVTVVVLDPSRDGVRQIHDSLSANAGLVAAIDLITNIASVDVISHVAPGEVMLGSTVLSAANLADYGGLLARIGSHLTDGADILLYGCDVASGATGQQFISALAAATGADVAASTGLTGSAAAGGDWLLEASTGSIETAALSIAAYQGVLDAAFAVNSVTLSADTGISSNDFITKTATQTINGTFAATVNGNSTPTLYVSTDGSGATRTQATVTYVANAGSGTFSVSVNLATGGSKSIQFWSGANGNNPLTGTRGYTLDTTAPTTTVSSIAFSDDSGSSSTDFITSAAVQTITGTLSANTVPGEMVRVSVDGGVNWQTASNTIGQNTFSLAGVNLGGSGILMVRVEDTAGNAGSARAQPFVLDNVPPAPGVLGLSGLNDSGTAGDGMTNDRTFTLSLDGNEAASNIIYEVSINGGAFSSTPDSQTDLADGSYQFRARVTDAAGNTATTNTVGVTIDGTAPDAPGITGFDDNSGSKLDTTTNDNTPTLTIAAEADSSVEVFRDGVSVGAATQTAPHSGAYTFTSPTLADGSYSFTASATDAAGNISAASSVQNVIVDTTLTAPTVILAIDSGQPGDALTNQAGLSFNTADSDAVRVIRVDGAVVDSYDAGALADGIHTVSVVDTDGAGNSKSASVTFTLDTALTAPTVSLALDSGQAGDGLTNQAGLNFNTADSDAVRVIEVDGAVVDSYDTGALADGIHTVSVVDTDGAGNSKSTLFVFTLDSIGPSFTSATAVSVAENIGENQVVYRAHATDEHFVVYSLDGADASKLDISAAGVVTLKDNPDFESVNAYHFSVVATDMAGNDSEQAVSLAITNVNEAPVASPRSVSTVESTAISFQLSDFAYDLDADDKLALSFNSSLATLRWANSDLDAPTALINPVTHAAVDLSSLNVQASISADGTRVTLAPPTELDWMVSGQVVMATFNYTVTDSGGLTSSNTINVFITGSTTDKGLNLNGGNGNDTLSGNATNNAEDLLQGGNGNDTISGYGGTDALYGGNGDDKLIGGAGIDYLYGDSGNDTLDGGADGDFIFGGKGNDVLIGGTGADKFVIEPQNGNDRILDFNIAEGDKLYIANFFSTPMSADAFVSKYVTDAGDDLLINLAGTSIVLVGVSSIGALTGAIALGMPS